MIETPVEIKLVQDLIREHQIRHVGSASIRELVSLVNDIERRSGVRFVRMEMGVPGLPTAEIGIEAEIEALKRGVSARYPDIRGVPALRQATARFIKAFVGVDVEPRCCLPTNGSTGASFVTFLVASRRQRERGTTLFLDPGFPVHKLQLQVLGLEQESLDVYDYRGSRLRRKLEHILSHGKVGTLLYSNPNNPTWICLTEEELQIIGELCNKYDVIALEDLAYLTMDFRVDTSRPFEAPYQPTVARYTDNYMLLISSSKLFSFAGERVGVMGVSSALFDSRFNDLRTYFNSDIFGHCLVYGAAYSVSSGVNHSAQHGLAAILDHASDGREPMLHKVRVYGQRAAEMKRMFLENGFQLIYDQDDGVPLADGFYFTIGYPGMSGDQLVAHLLYYGISAISLARTGSLRPDGVRACVSQVSEENLPQLEERLKLFYHHQQEMKQEETPAR